MADTPSTKAASFLSSLKSGAKPGGGLGGLGGLGAPPPVPASQDSTKPLLKRIDELERKLAEVLKTTGEPAEGEPPRAPTDLMMYLNSKMELLERKLQESQSEALRANLLLQEREQAQRRAQKEVEDMFRTIKENQRAAHYDANLREQVTGAAQKVQELEAKLEEAQLRMMPVEEVLRALEREDGMEALRREVEERVLRVQQARVERGEAAPPAPPKPSVHDIASDTGTVLMLTAKLAEMERELDEARRERDEERSRRATWEREVAASMAQANERWKKGGGVEVTVQVALETMALALREREAAQDELKDALDQAQSQPPGAPPDPILRARLVGAQERLDKLQKTLDQQLAVVQAWIATNG